MPAAATVVAFDLDDTLYDEADYVRSGLAAAHALLQRRGVACPSPARWPALAAGRPPLDALCADVAAARPYHAAMLAAYRGHVPRRLRPRPGARSLLAALRGRGIALALITDGRALAQRHKLAALGLTDAFDHVAISAQVGCDKRHPAAFLQTMRALPARAYAYVGDNTCKDFIWPPRLGWRCAQVACAGRNIHVGGPPLPYGVRRLDCLVAVGRWLDASMA